MCGISCHLSTTPLNINNVSKDIRLLLKRGYDSNGVGFFDTCENKLCIKRVLGDEQITFEKNTESTICFTHTRWSTTGKVCIENSHPHSSKNNKAMIVHNGIVENYECLTDENYETDTETLVNYYEQNNYNIIETVRNLKGVFAFVLFDINHPNQVHVYKQRSQSLLIGFSNDNKHCIIASESIIFLNNKFEHYMDIPSNKIITLTIGPEKIVSNLNNYYNRNFKVINNNIQRTPYPFKYWLIKEIYEQPLCVSKSINLGTRITSASTVELNGIKSHQKMFERMDKLIVLATGTSLHSALFFKQLIKKYINVEVYDASEFDIHVDLSLYDEQKNIGFLFISQSGETIDIIDILRDLKQLEKQNFFFFSIVNEINSLLSREVECGIYINSGIENSVASTKTFISQCVVLSLLTVYLLQLKYPTNDECINLRERIVSSIRELPLDIENTLISCSDTLFKQGEIITNMNKHHSCLILGTPFASNEASLKIKEITYKHAEGFSLGSLKHGPLALVSENIPVFILDNGSTRVKTIMNEILSRHGNITLISYQHCDIENIQIFKIPMNVIFQDVLNVIPFQMLSYEYARLIGINPDKPRNLAKCVTVL